jgi:UDP-glucose 4-epimerase
VERVLGKKIPYKFGPRRPGDPAELFADNTKAKKLLGYVSRHSDLDSIIRTSLAWHKSHPKGFS